MASGGCCSHDHDCEEEDCAPQWVLYKYIDIPQVSCLNEEDQGSCKNVFKPWHERSTPTESPLRSNDDDAELLIYIPYINRHDLDFSSVEALAPVQEWNLVENSRGTMEYPTK
eukprot:scaffold650490_cov34-Prasinocladus_malaysianus.AAC.1